MKRMLPALALLLALSAPAAAQGTPPAAAEAKPAWMEYKNPYAGEQNNLANPHRTADEATAWAARAVASALSFTQGGFDAQVRDAKKYFAPEGWQGYAAYLRDTKLVDVARSGQYAVATVAGGDPMVLSSGAMDGAWRWMIGVPVITSVQQPDPAGELKTVSSSKALVRVLLGRTADTADPDGIAIQGWEKGE